jgi:hypothetical protein
MIYEITSLEMWKEIKDFLKDLYLKLSCMLCCKSNCQVQLGRESPSLKREE